jgi:CPA1 family monovalent cation:H+ antiporter
LGADVASSLETIVPIFLIAIFSAAFLASRTKIPYTIMLVGIGIALSIFFSYNNSTLKLGIMNIEQFRIDPKLIIDFVIPPLIFEAMMRVDYAEFKKIRISAMLLATAGVVIATLVGGYLLMYLAGLPFLVAFALSALLSPTDSVMVIDLFKKVKVPSLLANLMESEASFNDATGAIAFSSIIALALGTGSAILGSSSSLNAEINTNENFGLGSHIISNLLLETELFVIEFFGGIAIGLAIAAAAHRLHKLMNDAFTEIALTVATVFGSTLLANSLGLSGLVAAAVAGLYFGNITIRKETIVSAKVRTSAFSFWEIIAFFASSAAFLYIGINTNIVNIAHNIVLIAIAFSAILAARAVSSYGILTSTAKLTKETIPMPWRHVAMLGGMRGAISVALAASLPESEFKNTVLSITFGVVLCSMIIQYILLSRYVRKSFPNYNDGTADLNL